MCLRLLGERMLAEDVLQESFVAVFKGMKSFKAEVTPGAWIKKIVVNNCVSQLRKRKTYFDDIDDDSHQLPDLEPESDDGTQYRVQMIKDAMRKLPQGYKVIFSLYAVEGYDHEEIASIMDISVSTSKSQYHRAKQKIRQLINSSYG